MITKIKEYEKRFVQYYSNKYGVAYIKVKHNKGLVPTVVTLYNENKRVIKHQPTYFGVTVKNMFAWLDENRIYTVYELLNEGSDDKN